MRWRSREEPWGSHHEEARAEKWESSVGETEDGKEEVERVCNRWGVRRKREILRGRLGRRDMMVKWKRWENSSMVLGVIFQEL